VCPYRVQLVSEEVITDIKLIGRRLQPVYCTRAWDIVSAIVTVDLGAVKLHV